ncbi:MAG: hypothetical protein RLZZ352_1720 [Pseudomonadota bacterium]|jgi:3-methyladenine DNA glycosylase AlkC
MAEALKHRINPDTVAQASSHLHRVWPGFDRQAFERHALTGLADLELKARAMQLADALQATLPPDFVHAAEVIEASLAEPVALDAAGEPLALTDAQAHNGLAGWVVWALGDYVARCGQGHVPRALACLHALTQRFSAEFAIRPFIAQHPHTTLAVLHTWLNDPSAHVRRLVSEGSRPRLPWGLRLHALVADPSPTLPLLLALQDDPSAYVRRSVANHLNDIAKDHPDVVARWVQTHREAARPERTALLRHASRSLIKQGHVPTLQAWGLGQAFQGAARLSLSSQRVTLGEQVALQLDVKSHAAHTQKLVVDYAVHHVRAKGSTSPKVFKGWTLELPALATRSLHKLHSLRPVSTRTLYPGWHRVEVRINGQTCAESGFMLA